MTVTTIEINNLTKEYNNIQAVKDINFKINKGTILNVEKLSNAHIYLSALYHLRLMLNNFEFHSFLFPSVIVFLKVSQFFHQQYPFTFNFQV